MKKKKIKKQFKCPHCDNIVTYIGLPGNNLPISCSYCGTKGKVTIQNVPQQINNSTIEIVHLKKVFGQILH